MPYVLYSHREQPWLMLPMGYYRTAHHYWLMVGCIHGGLHHGLSDVASGLILDLEVYPLNIVLDVLA
jgi:hypothetical protein